MNRSAARNSTPESWRRDQDDRGFSGPSGITRNRVHPLFPRSPSYSPGSFYDHLRIPLEEIRYPIALTSHPGSSLSPVEFLLIDGAGTARNTYPRARQQQQQPPAPAARSSGQWDDQVLHYLPSQDSKLTRQEQKKALSKLKRQSYNPMPKKIAKGVNLYFRKATTDPFTTTTTAASSLAEEDEDGKRCAVCLEDFQAKEVVTLTPCDHMFHEDCIVPWVRSHGQCPVCRFAICERMRCADSNGESNNYNTGINLGGDDHLYFGSPRELISVIRAIGGSF